MILEMPHNDETAASVSFLIDFGGKKKHAFLILHLLLSPLCC